MGIERNDRIAVLLPNGPELTVAILATAVCGVCVPMNTAYETSELVRYFDDIRPRALILESGLDTAARIAARAHAIPVIELSASNEDDAGVFTFPAARSGSPSLDTAKAEDAMLLLLTSGTTSRAKIVQLTHGNVCASAFSSTAALALGENDRCLNVLPQFHGHGLIATILASLAAGASVVCTPGCQVHYFFDWLSAFQPTWYSAVPTMHQAILTHARLTNAPSMKPGLRFVRSASAPLAPRILAELEQTFAAPVIEFYGMTETASAPIACNPLPPFKRKPGSVGIPVDLDVAIMGSRGDLCPTGETGQVVVRGPSVMRGYEGDPAANEAAFSEDWLQTGDLGYFDDAGFLFLTGRTRELINRGGEKISPREIDEALLDHPAVAEAATFAIPHATLGEDVAAAVVLRPGAKATSQAIRAHMVGRLAEFKVPQQVFFVRELPKSSTGKIQRAGMAARLGLGPVSQAFVPPRTALEKTIAEHWTEILQQERIGIHDNFFALGGDSLLATSVLAYLHRLTDCEIASSQIFETPTVAELAAHLESVLQGGKIRQSLSPFGLTMREEPALASLAQEQLWRLQRLLKGLPLLNVFCPLRLNSDVDEELLQRSMNELVKRHEVLRTTFTELDGRFVQIIAPRQEVSLTCDDLRKLSSAKRRKVSDQIIDEEAFHVFDLARGPLLRFRLLRLGDREHLLLMTMHGTIVDRWSISVLLEELSTFYAGFAGGSEARPPMPPVQYADFAQWQRRWPSQPEMVAQLAYWRGQLREPLPQLRLAVTGTARKSGKSRKARQELFLTDSLFKAASLFGAREGGTLYMALLAALNALLQRYSGQDDVRVCTLVANRNRQGSERIIGPVANTVVIRTDLGHDPTLREVMRRVRATTLAAFEHQDLPFEELAGALAAERGAPQAWAQVMMVLQTPVLRSRMKTISPLCFQEDPKLMGALATPTRFDLNLTFRENASALTASCVYNEQLFDNAGIKGLLRDFRRVLEQMVTCPEQRISTIRLSAGAQAAIGSTPSHSP
jgi:acyl-CoA synthetase (AMP-forming)/AMP-acid ligase II